MRYGYNEIKNSKIIFRNSDNSYIRDENIFQKVNGKNSFLERWEIIESKSDDKIKEINNQVEILNNKIIEIQNMSLDEFLINSELENLLTEENSFEIFLIENGYVSGDYLEYINEFVEGDIVKSDLEFILAVRNKNRLPYNYKLYNIENIIERLTESDFRKNEILNNDLINYLSGINDNEKIEKIIENNHLNDNFLEFVDLYVGSFGEKNVFVDKVVIESTNLWKKIFARKDNIEYIDSWVKRFLLNKESLKNIDDSFKEYICNHKSFDEKVEIDEIDEILSSLKSLNILFRGLKKISNEDFLQKIYMNNMYELNDNMICIMFQLRGVAKENDDLTIIFEDEKLTDMKRYVLDNFEEYYQNCYILNDFHHNNKQTILTILNNNEITTEIKEGIIKREKYNKYDIEDINSFSVQNLIAENNKINPTYKNILDIYKREEVVDDILINLIEKKIDDYCNQNLAEYENMYGLELIEKFKLQYIFNGRVRLEDFRKFLENEKINVVEMKELDNEKTKILIDYKYIDFNEFNYEFIKNNYQGMLYDFVANNKTVFLENIEKYNIELLKEQILTSELFDDGEKKIIIDHVEIEGLHTTTLMYLIKKGLIKKSNKNINFSILADEQITYEERIEFLEIIIGSNRLNRNECIEYVHLLGDEYDGIGCGKRPAKLEINEKNTNICNILYKYNIIGKFRPSKSNPENEYIVYNLK